MCHTPCLASCCKCPGTCPFNPLLDQRCSHQHEPLSRRRSTHVDLLVLRGYYSHELASLTVRPPTPMSSSAHGAERRAPARQDDAGGDLRPGAAHRDGERHGRGHPLRQRAREAAGPLHLLLRQEGEAVLSISVATMWSAADTTPG